MAKLSPRAWVRACGAVGVCYAREARLLCRRFVKRNSVAMSMTLKRSPAAMSEIFEVEPGCHVGDFEAKLGCYAGGFWSETRLLRLWFWDETRLLGRTNLAAPLQPCDPWATARSRRKLPLSASRRRSCTTAVKQDSLCEPKHAVVHYQMAQHR